MDYMDKIIKSHKKLEEDITQKYINDTAAKWSAFVCKCEKLWNNDKRNLNIPGKGMDFFSLNVLPLFNNFKSATIKEWKEYQDSMAKIYNGQPDNEKEGGNYDADNKIPADQKGNPQKTMR